MSKNALAKSQSLNYTFGQSVYLEENIEIRIECAQVKAQNKILVEENKKLLSLININHILIGNLYFIHNDF